jgi:hypothetical protein
LKIIDFKDTFVESDDSIQALVKAYPNIVSIVCQSPRLSFASCAFVLRHVTLRSFLSDNPKRQIIAMTDFLDSLRSPTPLLLVNELLSFNLFPRFVLLFSQHHSASDKFQMIAVSFLRELLSINIHSKILVREMTEAGVLSVLLQCISHPQEVEMVIVIFEIFMLILSVDDASRDQIVSFGIFLRLVKTYENDPALLVKFLKNVDCPLFRYSVHDLAAYLDFALRNFSADEFSWTCSSLFQDPPLVIAEAMVEVNFIPAILERILIEDDMKFVNVCTYFLYAAFQIFPLALPIDPQIVSLFVSQVCQQKKKMKIMGPCLSTIVTECAQPEQIIALGLIPSLLIHPPSSDGSDVHTVRCLLDIIKHSLELEGSVLLDHLIDSGLVSYLMQSLIEKYSNNQFLQTFTELIHLLVPQQNLVALVEDIVNGLQLLMRADARCFEKVLECDFPDELEPLLFDGFE